MGDHYPLCERYISGDGYPCICELLSQHADEMRAATLADLRAKVLALPNRMAHDTRAPIVFFHPAPKVLVVRRDEVLALFNGGSDDHG